MIIKRSYVWAVVIAMALGLWILSGQFGDTTAGSAPAESTRTETTPSETTPAETTPAGTTASIDPSRAAAPVRPDAAAGAASPAGEDLPAVRVRVFEAAPVLRDVVVRGRTEPVRSVQVRARTSGTIIDLPREKGDYVEKGDVLCRLDIAARDARLAEARALREQRWLQYDASRKLAARGHRSETQVAADKAAYDAAVAQVKQMEVELGYTRITAPFEGVLDARPVEMGDFLNVGQHCATVVDLDPLLVVGQVAEKDVDKLSPGTVGFARLGTGTEIEGVVRFIARTADEATRTFRIELEVPNRDRSLLAGLTAEIVVPAAQVRAHLLSPAYLVLNDAGEIGVRMVDENGIVHFRPIDIVEDGVDGVWVSGLPPRATVITVGQEFVREGMRVRVAMDGEADRS